MAFERDFGEAQACPVMPVAEEIEAMGNPPNGCFVWVKREAQLTEITVHGSDGPPQAPARWREDQNVVHIADIETSAVARGHVHIKPMHMEGPDQRAERTARRDAAGDLPEGAAIFHCAAHVLPQQVQRISVVHVFSKLIHELVMIDGGIVGFDIRAEHIAMLRQGLLHGPYGALQPAVAPQMRTRPVIWGGCGAAAL